MKINKKEYGMGGSTMEMYASGGMLKALLKDPKQREMAKAMINEFEDGGKVGDPEAEVALTAVPNKEDVMAAYKGSAGSQGKSFEEFLKTAPEQALKDLAAAARPFAEARLQKERKTNPNAAKAQQESGALMGSSYMPGSQRGYEAAGAANVEAIDENTVAMLKGLGLK
jgi:hypothetical protein